jgi:N-acetylglucosamine-6-phosphate deacetylase
VSSGPPASAGSPAGAPLLIAAERIITASPAADGAGSAGPELAGPGYVAVADGVITAVGSGPPPGRPDVELRSGTLLPGLVDLQVNGYYGVDFAAAGAAEWDMIAARLPETGTTAFLPTFITAPLDRLAAQLGTAAGFCGRSRPGARVLGLHMEGPFLAPSRRGAHRAEWIINPGPAAVAGLMDAAGRALRLVTLAPETDGALAATDQLTAGGVLVSVGHTDATARQVAAAADHGARMVTHLFNAQRPFGHREPGVPGQALGDPRLTSGLIADGHHVDPLACLIAFRAAPGRICLVTDAAACAGMPPGRYLLGGEPIELPPGDQAPPVRADGTMAGSALRMDRAVANLVAAGVSCPEAVAAATRVPADLIGRPDLGRLAVGAAADLAWLGDDMRTMATWIGGELVYSRAERTGT